MVFILQERAPHYFKDPCATAVVVVITIIIIIITHLGRWKGISEQ